MRSGCSSWERIILRLSRYHRPTLRYHLGQDDLSSMGPFQTGGDVKDVEICEP